MRHAIFQVPGLLLLGLSVACCADAGSVEEEFAVRVQSAYVEPFLAGNEQAWLDAFSPNAVGLHDGLPALQGKDAIGEFFRTVHSMFEIQQFDVSVNEVRTNGSWAITQGVYQADFVARSEQAPADVAGPRQGKFLLVWEKDDAGDWRIIYDMGNSTMAPPAPPVDLEKGKQAYYACESCHWPSAEGNAALGAPALAGMDAAYLERQLQHYRNGVRGHDLADLQGRQMTLLAATLADEQQVRDVSAYISSLPSVFSPPDWSVQGGDQASQLYQSCAACHGVDTLGDPRFNAPALGGQLQEYLAMQMRHFRDGLRGKHPDDAPGQQMAAISGSLSDEEIKLLSQLLSGGMSSH